MPEPTNPKKRALMPSTKLRKALRAAGHHLSPVVQIGKEGVTDAVLRQLDEQLGVHELVKVKVGTESPEDRFEAAERIGEAAGAQLAQILGRTVLVYRRHPEKPRFEPLTAAEERERGGRQRDPEGRAARRPQRRRAGKPGGPRRSTRR
jgi:RNA-binding protein